MHLDVVCLFARLWVTQPKSHLENCIGYFIHLHMPIQLHCCSSIFRYDKIPLFQHFWIWLRRRERWHSLHGILLMCTRRCTHIVVVIDSSYVYPHGANVYEESVCNEWFGRFTWHTNATLFYTFSRNPLAAPRSLALSVCVCYHPFISGAMQATTNASHAIAHTQNVHTTERNGK